VVAGFGDGVQIVSYFVSTLLVSTGDDNLFWISVLCKLSSYTLANT
jgi:hypothetical protein